MSLTDQYIETFDIEPGTPLPPLARIAAGQLSPTPVVEGNPVAQRIESTYFDTMDRRLAAAGLSVCRRNGPERGEWRVGIPGPGGEQQFRMPVESAASTVPAAIRKLVWASSHGEPLRQVARFVTERTTHRLIDAAGQVIVELADDRVSVTRLNGAPADSAIDGWREVELHAQAAQWRDAVAGGLRDIGGREADARNELARLHDEGGDDRRGAEVDEGRPSRHPSPESSAGEVVLSYVSQQLAQIVGNDPLVRLDAPGSVHRMRVATRRLRSALQTFQPVLHPEAVVPVRSELRWLAGELGAARDAEVMRDRVLNALQEEDQHVHIGPLGGAVEEEMSQAYRAAHDGLLRALDSQRYHRLVVALHNLVVDPPLTDKADRPASRVLPRRAARAYARLRALVKGARHASTAADRDTQLHEARKAAKKARYAGETLTEFFGKPAARFAAAMERVQEELGEHQDSVVMRARIEQLAGEETTSAAAFAYGRLHAREEQRGELAVAGFQTAWRKAKKKELRAWLE